MHYKALYAFTRTGTVLSSSESTPELVSDVRIPSKQAARTQPARSPHVVEHRQGCMQRTGLKCGRLTGASSPVSNESERAKLQSQKGNSQRIYEVLWRESSIRGVGQAGSHPRGLIRFWAEGVEVLVRLTTSKGGCEAFFRVPLSRATPGGLLILQYSTVQSTTEDSHLVRIRRTRKQDHDQQTGRRASPLLPSSFSQQLSVSSRVVSDTSMLHRRQAGKQILYAQEECEGGRHAYYALPCDA